ncbi:MAG: 50S ribosome-binding GTPase [Acidimicrobiia bacterium]|nr:50S ribosome-binding GTPase [Acidimicrobiia bacterium]
MSARAEAVAASLPLAEGRFPPAEVASVADTLAKVRDRMRHGTEHTVVALIGPTGAGKSSLFNALAGFELSRVGLRRPTTGEVHACVWPADATSAPREGGSPDAAGLLDWLGVGQRHHRAAEDGLGGLVLLDLPDFDSVEAAHQIEVDRLVELVDLLVFVVDPQKYADQSLHAGYIAPLAGHGPVLRFVLNQADRLDPSERVECVADFGRRIAADGVAGARPLAVSSVTGEGLGALRDELATVVEERASTVARLHADLAAAAGVLARGGPERADVPRPAREALLDELGEAVSVPSMAELAAQRHGLDARAALGWPPTRWIARRRRNPLASLARPEADPFASSRIDAALRTVAEACAADLPEPWPAALRERAAEARTGLVDALRVAVRGAVQSQRRRPRWWAAVVWLHRLAAVAALVGLVWLAVLVAVDSFLLVDAEAWTPKVRGWLPVPTLLLFGGLGGGLLLAWLVRFPVAAAARRRARAVRSELRSRLAAVAEREILSPLRDVLGERAELESVLGPIAAGRQAARAGVSRSRDAVRDGSGVPASLPTP